MEPSSLSDSGRTIRITATSVLPARLGRQARRPPQGDSLTASHVLCDLCLRIWPWIPVSILAVETTSASQIRGRVLERLDRRWRQAVCIRHTGSSPKFASRHFFVYRPVVDLFPIDARDPSWDFSNFRKGRVFPGGGFHEDQAIARDCNRSWRGRLRIGNSPLKFTCAH